MAAGGFAEISGSSGAMAVEGQRNYSVDWSANEYVAILVPVGARLFILKSLTVALSGLQFDPVGTAIGTTKASLVAAQAWAVATDGLPAGGLPFEVQPGMIIRLASASNLGTVEFAFGGSMNESESLPALAGLTVVTDAVA
jgi:hypothetical protein